MPTALSPAIVQAAGRTTVLAAALTYAALGLSVLPLNGKRPALSTWRPYQYQRVEQHQIWRWYHRGQLQNVGLACGSASGNLVVLDLDDPAGYAAFVTAFPELADTYTVATGGGRGKHLYWFVDRLPFTTCVMNTTVGHLELLARGRQVVAPPSRHPQTGRCYRVDRALDILTLPKVDDVVAWMTSFRPQPVVPRVPPARRGPFRLNPRLIQTLTEYFVAQNFKCRGTWLNGRCIYPQHHRHQDAHPSFGFNVVTGYGYCYRCGTILAREICATVGIDLVALGGLYRP